MGCIAVDDLSQGMVLNEDVFDIHGRLLLSKGQMISSKHLRILKIWGVCEVNVVNVPHGDGATAVATDDESSEEVRLFINYLFKNLDLGHEIIQVVHQAAIQYRCKNGAVIKSVKHARSNSNRQAAPSSEKIRRRIEEKAIHLPDAPAIINELNAVIADPIATSNDVAQVVTKSPSMASLLLRIVNSAFYGFPSKIDRISRAVTILGTKEISGLALGICVMRAFKDIPPELIDMSSFIRHSLACSLIARIIAAQKNIVETEQLSVAGLLHDIGKLIVLKYFPDVAADAFENAAASGESVCASEKLVCGMNHAQIARQLLKKWKIPAVLENSIAFHHNPSAASDPSKAAIVQMADIIANGLGLGNSGEQCIPCFDDKAWDRLNIPACNMNLVIRQALHQFGAMDFSVL